MTHPARDELLAHARPEAGRPYPLGATWDGVGTNFSVFSEVANRVEIALFDDTGNETRVAHAEVSGHQSVLRLAQR